MQGLEQTIIAAKLPESQHRPVPREHDCTSDKWRDPPTEDHASQSANACLGNACSQTVPVNDALRRRSVLGRCRLLPLALVGSWFRADRLVTLSQSASNGRFAYPVDAITTALFNL